ncbi:hypothetical protein F4819DRAFT_152861 [Hypoxylon fuscum]|nr:hypothetical protein F4819DRAFT_152861 [Hypoxylon fuscum]
MLPRGIPKKREPSSLRFEVRNETDSEEDNKENKGDSNVADKVEPPAKRLQLGKTATAQLRPNTSKVEVDVFFISDGRSSVDISQTHVPVLRKSTYTNSCGTQNNQLFLFDRTRSPCHVRVASSNLIFYDEQKQTSHLMKVDPSADISDSTVDRESLVIYVKGLRLDDDMGCWSVYFGPESKLNARGVFRKRECDPPLTNMRVETEAIGEALHMVSIIRPGHPLFKNVHWVAIASDSSFLINEISKLEGPTTGKPLIEKSVQMKL